MDSSKYKILSTRLRKASNEGKKAHVVFSRGNWIIFRENDKKVLGRYSSRIAAYNKAKLLFNKGEADGVVLHRPNGKVEDILTTS
jgi:hypothetical protein